MRHRSGGGQIPDSVQDFGICSAAAEVAGQVMFDVVVGRMRVLLEQLAGHEHKAGCAEPALERGRGDESLLHRIEPLAIRETLDRAYVAAIGEARQVQAAGDGHTVDEHRAAATQALPAAFARTVQVEAALQDVQDGFGWTDQRVYGLAVEREPDGASKGGHWSIPSGAP